MCAAPQAQLGGYKLPPAAELLASCPTVGAVAKYVEEHCPVQGDCRACPTRHKCTAHDQNGDGSCADIEDCVATSSCVQKKEAAATVGDVASRDNLVPRDAHAASGNGKEPP